MRKNWQVRGYAGLPSSSEWSQTSVVELGLDRVGAIVVSLRAIESAELIDLPMIGLTIVDELRKQTKEKFEQNLTEWEEELKQATKGIGVGIKVQVGVILLAQAVIRTVGSGGLVVKLRRKGEMYTLLEGGGKVRGELKEGDTVWMVTKETGGRVEEIEQLSLNEEASAVAGVVIGEEPIAGKTTKLSLPRMYVGEVINSHRYRYIGMGVLTLLIIMVIMGAYLRGVKAKEKAWVEVKEQVTTLTKSASDEVVYDPEKARQDLAHAKAILDEYQKVAKGKYLAQTGGLRQTLSSATTSIFRQNEVNLSTWIELSMLQVESNPKQIILGDNEIIYLPRESGLGGVSVKDKSQLTIEVSNAGNYRDWVIVGKTVYALGTDGIYGMAVDKGIEMKRLVEADDAWQNPSRLFAFGGSLYVLDTGSGEISKYAIVEGQLASRKRWFGKGIVLDLSKIVDMVVDGDVWLLSSSGKLERYSRGAPVRFEIAGFANAQGEKKFSEPIAVATSDTEVFVLERSEGRVVVFDKDGTYSRQYVNKGLTTAVDLVIDGDKAYVLTDKEIKVFAL